MLITDIINQASSQLREAGIETPEHDAKLLLAEAAGVELRDVDRALLMGEELGTTGQLAVFRAMLDRRARREPLQYITGHAPFRYLDLKVGPGVLIPRPETETVVQAGLDWLTKNGMNPFLCGRFVRRLRRDWAVRCQRGARQPGVGGGAVAEHRRMDARNLSETAKKYPSIASNYHLEIADATSFATLVQLDGTVDIVITNPPYVPQTDIPQQPEVRDWDPELALYGGSNGRYVDSRAHYRAGLPSLLKPGAACHGT